MLIIGAVSLGYSQENAKDKYYKGSIHINLPVMEAWNLITEIPIWKKWDNRIIDLRFDGQMTKRARGSLITKNGKVVEFIIVDLVKGDTYTFKHKLSSGMLFVKRTVRASDNESKITKEIWVKGLSFKTLIRYLGEDHNLVINNNPQTLEEYINNLD